MKVRALRVLAALVVSAVTTGALAQSPTYEDGSEADVYYFAAEEAGHQVAAPEAAAPVYADGDVYEPGVADASAHFEGCDASGNSCGGCDGCGDNCNCRTCQNPCHGWWARGEYLMWWMSGAIVPPLVTTSPNNTPITEAGVLPDAEILFPVERLGIDGRSGGRATLGYWFDEQESWGIEGNYWALDKGGDGFQAVSDIDGSPILARPFIDAATGLEDAFIVSYPDVFAGSITVASSSDVMGAEINLRRAMLGNRYARFDLLAGYRYVKVRESLSVYENQISIDPGAIIPLGTEFSIQDDFAMRNEFHGGQVGMILQKEFRRWTIEGTGKVALGSWRQEARIGGFTSVSVPGVPTVVNEGGILALASNSGNFERDRFAAIPEAGLTLRYQLNKCAKVSVGYTFMYLQRIVRPGNNIDRRIDTDQLPPPIDVGGLPEFKFKESDAWLQGVSVGLEARF